MTHIAASPEVRAEATRRAKRRVRRWHAIGLPLALLAISLLAGAVLAVAMGGIG